MGAQAFQANLLLAHSSQHTFIVATATMSAFADVSATATSTKLQEDNSMSALSSSAEVKQQVSQKRVLEMRSVIIQLLANIGEFVPSNDPRAFHGRWPCANIDVTEFPEPEVLWASSKKPRESSPDWLTATEYADRPDVLAAKVKMLKELLLCSRRTLAYTGAGLSVAAGIGMAAVGSKGGAGTGMGIASAGEPTLAHCVMAELNRQNLLHGWVQQNHDGLPQKAGYRQEDINEVHGSWYDPGNPVVKYGGTLRSDLYTDMVWQAQNADLVVVLGTSLTGLNADQCVTHTARRSIRPPQGVKRNQCLRRNHKRGADRSATVRALGSVIISPQRTPQDGTATLRIFAKADDVMEALAQEFDFEPRAMGHGVSRSADLFPMQSQIIVPYDRNGVLSTEVKTCWDLSVGEKVRISAHNNIEGAMQPADKDLTCDTVGTICRRREETCSILIDFNGTKKQLGLWWLETAQRGGMQHLPVVNVNAKEMPA